MSVTVSRLPTNGLLRIKFENSGFYIAYHGEKYEPHPENTKLRFSTGIVLNKVTAWQGEPRGTIQIVDGYVPVLQDYLFIDPKLAPKDNEIVQLKLKLQKHFFQAGNRPSSELETRVKRALNGLVCEKPQCERYAVNVLTEVRDGKIYNAIREAQRLASLFKNPKL